MNFTGANGRGFILTAPSLENVGSSTTRGSWAKPHSTRKLMERRYVHVGQTWQNTSSLTGNTNPEHWLCSVERRRLLFLMARFAMP